MGDDLRLGRETVAAQDQQRSGRDKSDQGHRKSNTHGSSFMSIMASSGGGGRHGLDDATKPRVRAERVRRPGRLAGCLCSVMARRVKQKSVI
jgi:hypothetical protein